MLPRRLAQDICSVSPGADSLAHTVEMEMNSDGEVLDFDAYRSVIESDAHLTYTHSDAILDGFEAINENYMDNDVEHEEARMFNDIARSLDNLDGITQSIRENRWDESLLLNQRKSDSSRIIEEMMVTANKTIGKHLREEGIGAYRVEEAPEKGWTDEVATEFSRMGYEPPSDLHENPTKAINDFFADTIEPEDEKQAVKAVSTKLPRAKFRARGQTPAGHFGLGALDYAQFTSPIRRVTDLVNHRIVAGTFDEGRGELSKIAENASEQYEAADNAAMAWYDANT